LDFVTAEYMPKVYMTEGHDEVTLGTSFMDALEKENVGYEFIKLKDYDAVPEDATCLFINAAIKDFTADEAEKVIKYLDNGGKVILVLGYTDEEMPNLETITDYMGLSVAEGTVLDLSKEYYYKSPYYLLPVRKECDYTFEVFQTSYIFTPYARGILIDNKDAEGMSYETFLYTTDNSFSKVNPETTEDYEKREGDIDGPFVIALEAVKRLEDGEAMLVAFGSEKMFDETADAVFNGANLKVFSNMMSKLVGRESTISIASKSFDTGYVLVDMYTAVMISALVTFILPMTCVVIGFVIWFRRRKR
jgi:ABC-2 type transport system permease protein